MYASSLLKKKTFQQKLKIIYFFIFHKLYLSGHKLSWRDVSWIQLHTDLSSL